MRIVMGIVVGILKMLNILKVLSILSILNILDMLCILQMLRINNNAVILDILKMWNIF